MEIEDVERLISMIERGERVLGGNFNIVNYRNVLSTVDFSGRPLRKDPRHFASYFPGFNWKGVVLAGGAVLSILRGEPVKDFDFWLYGSEEEITAKLFEIEFYFRNKRAADCEAVALTELNFSRPNQERGKFADALTEEKKKRYNFLWDKEKEKDFFSEEEDPEREELRVLNKTLVSFKRGNSFVQMEFESFPPVQLIPFLGKDLSRTGILYLMFMFDFSCCRCWFDGTDLWGTAEQISSLVGRGVVEIDDDSLLFNKYSIARMPKYIKRGFRFMIDKWNVEKYIPIEYSPGNPNIILGQETIPFIEEKIRFWCPPNSGFICDSFEEALTRGPFSSVDKIVCGYSNGLRERLFFDSERIDYSKYFWKISPSLLEREKVKRELMKRKIWKLDITLRDFFYRPGGPGSLRALVFPEKIG